MSKHAIDRSAWTPEERDEYEDLLAEITESTKDTTERLDLFEAKLADAVQAQRPWAAEVDWSCRRFGMGKEISRYEARNRAMVAYDGRVLSVPRVQSRKVTSPAGEVAYQRELIELWTWEQIREKRVEAIKSQQTYTDKIAHYDRLLALLELAPESASPTDAANRIGVDLDDYLGKDVAA